MRVIILWIAQLVNIDQIYLALKKKLDNGACEIQNQIPTHNQEKSNSGGGDYLEHEHVEAHQHEHNHHHHHHSIYPNSKHPLGPVTLRLPNKD